MRKDGSFVTWYAKANKLNLDTFILAATQYGHTAGFPQIWEDPKLITETCVECQECYWPARKGSRFCSSLCGSRSRMDAEYFGGNRKNTVGLADSVCQLCERTVSTGLSSHHIYGKGNDEGNEFLLALCKGCHAIVSELALKKWCGSTPQLERLLWLAYTQRNGADLIKLRQEQGAGVKVEVSFISAHYEQS